MAEKAETQVDREKKFVVVMGHPRSGTGYMSKLFKAFGLDVGHENQMGEDGISSWLFGGCENPRWGPDPNAYEFENRIHLVRYPLSVISSVLWCVPEGVQEYMAREAGVDPELDPPRRAVEVYLKWHERIDTRKPNMRVQVEHAPDHLREWLGKVPDADLMPDCYVNSRAKHMGGCNPPDFTWDDFRRDVPINLTIHIERLTMEYGYRFLQ